MNAYAMILLVLLQAEVRAEYEQAKRECWPEPVPSYGEWRGR